MNKSTCPLYLCELDESQTFLGQFYDVNRLTGKSLDVQSVIRFRVATKNHCFQMFFPFPQHKHGWRFQKRPGVDMFLSQVGYPNFELVVYTTENPMTFYPIIDGLDPNSQYIMYRLFRDATRYVDGHHKKDLSALNRDLKKVIVVDWNENVVDCNRENALLLQKWEGDNADRALIGLAQLLQGILNLKMSSKPVFEAKKAFPIFAIFWILAGFKFL